MADQSVNLRAGLHNVGSYQVSGIPFVTGALTAPATSSAPLEITFPSVTQRIQIHNNFGSDKPIRVGFSANGVKGSNYWLVEAHQSNGKSNDRIDLRVKTTKIYLLSDDNTAVTSSIYVLAELTGITGYDLATAYSGATGIG
jgi:hypothetical protein